MEGKTLYSEREKLLLVQLVSQYSDIIENKKTDATTSKEKYIIWDKRTTAFNSQGLSTRTVKQIRKCWENIKQRKRGQNTADRQNRLLTGGGPFLNVTNDPVLDFVDAAAPRVDVQLPCSWDSNAIFEKQNNIVPEEADKSKVSFGGDEEIDLRNELPKPKRRRLEMGTTGSSKYSNHDWVLEERKLRIQKIQDSIVQQKELHEKRMIAADAEAKLAILRLQHAEAQLWTEERYS